MESDFMRVRACGVGVSVGERCGREESWVKVQIYYRNLKKKRTSY